MDQGLWSVEIIEQKSGCCDESKEDGEVVGGKQVRDGRHGQCPWDLALWETTCK